MVTRVALCSDQFSYVIIIYVMLSCMRHWREEILPKQTSRSLGFLCWKSESGIYFPKPSHCHTMYFNNSSFRISFSSSHTTDIKLMEFLMTIDFTKKNVCIMQQEGSLCSVMVQSKLWHHIMESHSFNHFTLAQGFLIWSPWTPGVHGLVSGGPWVSNKN